MRFAIDRTERNEIWPLNWNLFVEAIERFKFNACIYHIPGKEIHITRIGDGELLKVTTKKSEVRGLEITAIRIDEAE